MRAQNAVVEKKSANGIGDGGEGGSIIEHKTQKSKSAQRGKNESAEGKGEEAGGSKSKLNGHSDCIMELLAEIQMDIKTNRRQCEKIEQVLASHHTRAIEETNAAVHDAKAAIEVVRQMRVATLSPYSSSSSLLTPRSPYSSPSSSLTPGSPSSVLRQMPPASTSPVHTLWFMRAPHADAGESVSFPETITPRTWASRAALLWHERGDRDKVQDNKSEVGREPFSVYLEIETVLVLLWVIGCKGALHFSLSDLTGHVLSQSPS
jgi:hypothetical protein